jgi:ligand-binding SRPBCC domain-containing protein
MSWIHIDDIVGLFMHQLEALLSARKVAPVLNGAAPNPATNADFSRALGKALGKPAAIPAPAAALKFALGEMADIVLTGQKAKPLSAVKDGYQFKFPSLEGALENLCGGRRQGAEVLEAVQWVPHPVEKVFQFFCDEKNLEQITPPFLNFNVLGKSTPEIQEGTLIDYRLKLHGLPMKWRTRIEKWRPNEAFVDLQLSGPYTRWEHTHGFQSVRGGTLMTDEVLYRLPMGVLGKGVAGGYVRGDVSKIFEYRKEVIRKVFG